MPEKRLKHETNWREDGQEDDDRAVAWLLLTELRTRITTQELPLRDGVEETALESVVQFFRLARETIGQHPLCQSCATIVVDSLNRDVRPFTARWHARKIAGHMGSVDERYAFRQELTELQKHLRELADRLAAMAGEAPATAPAEPATTAVKEASPCLPFGILPADGLDSATIQAINAAEAQDVKLRRRHYKQPNAEQAADAVGLALSGGGIRSATFGLGVIQELARRGMLREVDFLSTVSGGSYLGSFINTVVDDPDPDVGLAPGQRPFGGDGDKESTVVRHLRNHSKYLSEGGLGTMFQLGFALLYGVWVSLLLVLPYLMLAAAALVAGWPDAFGAAGKTPGWLAGTTTWAWVPVLSAALLYALARSRGMLHWIETLAGWLLALSLIASALPWLPTLSQQAAGNEKAWLAAAALLPFSLGAAGFAIGPNRRAGRVLLGSLVPAGPMFFLAALLACIALSEYLTDWNPWLPAGFGLVLLAIATWGVRLNFASLHQYYRDRLSRTYLVSGGKDGLSVNEHDTRLLGASPNPVKGPVHLINAALNVPASKHPGLRGRDADFFLFSKHFCGSALTGWYPTKEWQDLDRNLDLGTAMAISGAAATPHMGALTSPRYTVLLAMLNVRLGYWVRKPLTCATSHWRILPPAASLYFLRELTGRLSEHTPCVNVSDGGHIENLGIYELLRRRCRTIIAIDGECDPLHHFNGLLTLVRMAWIDLGVRIEPDLRDLRPDAAAWCNSHFIVTRIIYPGDQYGLLLYAKLSMTGNESEYLKQHRQEYPAFPHDSTAQQLFGEAQWEAYRALGEHVGRELFSKSLLDGYQPANATEWVERLAQRLGA